MATQIQLRHTALVLFLGFSLGASYAQTNTFPTNGNVDIEPGW